MGRTPHCGSCLKILEIIRLEKLCSAGNLCVWVSLVHWSLNPSACLLAGHLQGLVASEQQESVQQYVKAALHKSDRERSETAKDKTGVFTGDHQAGLHPTGVLLLLRGNSLYPAHPACHAC